jgi:hypothetical protein
MSGLLHLTDQPYCKKSRPAKVKDEIINLILNNYLIDRYISKEYFTVVIFKICVLQQLIRWPKQPCYNTAITEENQL